MTTPHQPKDYSADVGAAQRDREWRTRLAAVLDLSEIREGLDKATTLIERVEARIERAEALLGKVIDHV